MKKILASVFALAFSLQIPAFAHSLGDSDYCNPNAANQTIQLPLKGTQTIHLSAGQKVFIPIQSYQDNKVETHTISFDSKNNSGSISYTNNNINDAQSNIPRKPTALTFFDAGSLNGQTYSFVSTTHTGTDNYSTPGVCFTASYMDNGDATITVTSIK